MRNRERIAIGWTLVLMLASLGAAPQSLQRGSTRVEQPVAAELGLNDYHALVIGINEYTSLTPLETAVRDAEAVGRLLADQYGFNVVLQRNPTRGDIIAELARLRRKLTADSSLLIYYAGHGFLDEETEVGYWLPVDADEDHQANWIANQDITTQLQAIQAHHVMIVADSCYSGTLTRNAGVNLGRDESREEWLRRMARRKSRTAMTSGGAEPVVDGGGGGHSVFAKAFMDKLRENDTVLDGRALFEQLKGPVVFNAQQTPRYAGIFASGHDEGDFLFVPRHLRQAGEGGLTIADVTAPGAAAHIGGSTSVLLPSELPSGPPKAAWIELAGLNRPVRLAGGEFRMGVGGSGNELPEHQVTLSPFYIQEHEVTHGEYQKFDDRHRFMPGHESKPVLGLTWHEARAYAQWIGGDLPTEAQWEFAARGAQGRTYPWGEATPTCEHANFAGCGASADVMPVGGRRKGATPEGVLDLAGNAPEWVLDWFGAYRRNSLVDPTGPEAGSQKVLRGGSFGLDTGPLRAAARFAMQPDIPGNGNGFRVAWTEAQYLAARGEEAPESVASLD